MHPIKGIQVAGWIISISFLIFMNGFLATWLKRQLVTNAWVTGLAALVLVLIAVLDHFGFIRLTAVSTRVFVALAETPWLVVFPASLMALFYFIQYRFLRARMYPEEVIKVKSTVVRDIPLIRYLSSCPGAL